MRRGKAGWLILILTMFVLLAPAQAGADLWYWNQPGGDDGGDPDRPMGPGYAPGWRAGGVRGDDGGYQKPRLTQVERGWMGRYLTMLSGLRNYYLRF